MVFPIRRVLAFLVLTSAVTLSSCESYPLCTYLMLRLDDPIDVRYAGLDADEPDLLSVNVVTGVVPKYLLRRQVTVPHGWEDAPAVVRSDGSIALTEPMVLPLHEGEAPLRERLFRGRNIRRWDAEVRAENDLRLAADLPSARQRTYRITAVADDSGARTFEVFARSGSDAERMIGTVGVPANVEPPQLSFGTKALLLPALLLIDGVFVAATVVVGPVVLPLVLLKTGPEPTDDPGPPMVGM